MKKLPREQLILKAVLLLRTVNKNESKEEQLKMMAQYYSIEQLENYIEHFYDPAPTSESSYDEDYTDEDEYYTPSCTCHDYSPSNPWDAPGMGIYDFI